MVLSELSYCLHNMKLVVRLCVGIGWLLGQDCTTTSQCDHTESIMLGQ